MIKLRKNKPEDIALIISLWINSYHSGMTGYKPNLRLMFKRHQDIIKKGLESGSMLCIVACSQEDEDIILGFVVIGMDRTIHYVAVKETYKRLGVAKNLIQYVCKTKKARISHITRDLQYIKKIIQVEYDPYSFFQGVLNESDEGKLWELNSESRQQANSIST